jgi:hypothetical protein
LRLVTVIAGMALAAGCVPVDPGYDGYATTYAPGYGYAPSYGYAPEYGYGGGVTVFSGGGYYGRPYYHGRRDYRRHDRPSGWGGGHGGWNGHRGGAPNRGGGGLFPGLPRAGQQHQSAPRPAPSGGNHGHGWRDRRH